MGASSPSQVLGPCSPWLLISRNSPAARHPSCRHSPSAGFLALIPFVTEGDYYILYIHIHILSPGL